MLEVHLASCLARQTPKMVLRVCPRLCRIRLLYPSEWNSAFWRDKILKAKLKRTALWEKFASLLGSAQGDRSSVAQTIEPRIVNSLSIRVRNIHVHIVDDYLGATPWAFEVRGSQDVGSEGGQRSCWLFPFFAFFRYSLSFAVLLASSFMCSCLTLCPPICRGRSSSHSRAVKMCHFSNEAFPPVTFRHCQCWLDSKVESMVRASLRMLGLRPRWRFGVRQSGCLLYAFSAGPC